MLGTLQKFGLFLNLVAIISAQKDFAQTNRQLLEYVLSGINTMVAPRVNLTVPIKVDVGLSLNFIRDLNLREQIFSSSYNLKLEWNDYQLVWDKAKYDGIDHVFVQADLIWTPNIVLKNSNGQSATNPKGLVKVKSNGDVVSSVQFSSQSICTIDVTNFPFDQQICILKFGSGTYNTNTVALSFYDNMTRADTSEYYEDVTYSLVEIPAFLNVYDDGDTDITFYLTFKRRLWNPLLCLIFPNVLMSILFLLIQWMPILNKSRVPLNFILIFASCVFYLFVINSLPPTSYATPWIIDYMLFLLILQSVALTLTILLTKLMNNQDLFSLSAFKWAIKKVSGNRQNEHQIDEAIVQTAGEANEQQPNKGNFRINFNILDQILFITVVLVTLIKTIYLFYPMIMY